MTNEELVEKDYKDWDAIAMPEAGLTPAEEKAYMMTQDAFARADDYRKQQPLIDDLVRCGWAVVTASERDDNNLMEVAIGDLIDALHPLTQREED